MAENPEIDLLIAEKINTQNIFIPRHSSEWVIAELPLTAELIRKLHFFKIYKLGELNSIPYRKILKKFLNVNLRSYNLVAELYSFLTSLESTENSFSTEKKIPVEKKEILTHQSKEKESEIHAENFKDESEVKKPLPTRTSHSSDDEFEDFLEATILIAPHNREHPIASFDISVRLENVLCALNVEKLGDLHERSFRQIFQTRNCGRKSILELRDLIAEIHKDEPSICFRRLQDTDEADLEKINIPLYLRDLPVNYLIESVPLRKLLYSFEVKTLGDLHDFPVSRIRKNKNAGERIFSEFQSLTVKVSNGELDEYLEGEQPDSFKGKLLSKLSRPVYVPEVINDVPVNLISFSTRLTNILRDLKVETLGDLEKITFEELKNQPGIGKDSVFELWQFACRMQKGESEQKDIRAGLDFILSDEPELSALTLNSVLKFINEFLADLPEREREVLLYRFAGTTEEKILTLEEIGEKFDVTRERIRQMESKNIKQLKSRLSGISEAAFEKLSDDCRTAVSPLTTRLLIHLTGNEYTLFEYPPKFYLRLISELSPAVSIFDENQPTNQLNKNAKQISRSLASLLDEETVFLPLAEIFERISRQNSVHNLVMKDFFDAIRANDFIIESGDSADVLLIATDKNRLNSIEIARQILKNSEAALTPEEIIKRAAGMFGAEVELPTATRLINLPFYESDFYLLDRRTIGLRQHFRLPEENWKQLQDDFYNLLKNENRPVSTTEVLSKNLFEWTKQISAYEATEILREDTRFKDLGRFLFALDEWQIEEREPVKDLVIRILREAGHPLTAPEIGEQIQKHRSAFTAALSSMLNNLKEIKKYDFGYYGLNEWDDNFREFFLTNPKVLNRLVKRAKSVTFQQLCENFNVSLGEELAGKMWRTLRTIEGLRFDPVYKSPETKISSTL